MKKPSWKTATVFLIIMVSALSLDGGLRPLQLDSGLKPFQMDPGPYRFTISPGGTLVDIEKKGHPPLRTTGMDAAAQVLLGENIYPLDKPVSVA